MPDISQSSQATISQALSQLSQLAPTSEAARQGVDVLVKHLAGNMLSLNKSTVLLNKSVLLNNPQINGKIADGQTHQVKLSLENSPSLEFYSPTSAKLTHVIPLTEQQLQSLLRLPAKQLVPSTLLPQSETTNKLPTINATVLPALSKDQLSAQASTEHVNNQLSNSLVNTKNTHNQQSILRVLLTDQRPPLEVALPVKQSNQFNIGEKVTLAITPKGNNWQLTIVPNKTDGGNLAGNSNQDRVLLGSQSATSKLPSGQVQALSLRASQAQIPNKIDPQLQPQTTKTHLSATETRIAPGPASPELNISKDQHSILRPLTAIPLIKASLRGSNLAKPESFALPIKAVLQQLSKNSSELNQGIIQKLQHLPIDKITLQTNSNGEINLLIQTKKPVASIPVSKELAQALAPLKLPNQHALNKQFTPMVESNKQQQMPTQLTQTSTDYKSKVIAPPVDGSHSPEIKISMKEAGLSLLAAVQDKPMPQSVITPSLITNKPQQINLVQSLLRIVQAKAEAPAGTLQLIEKALVDVEFFKGATEQSSKQLVEQVLQQIKQALPQGKDQDAQQIRQLLTTPALNLSALQMVSPTASQGFMSGLVTLLQMSLSARLVRNQSNRAEHITETLNNVLSGSSKVKPSVSAKAMGEMSQLEQKHQLMKEIGRLLSGHQTNKLSNAEQMIQGQESFYYNLPSALGGVVKDIELLIKREENTKDNANTDEQQNRTWQLTMKLAVGEMGELLTKAKLRADVLDLNFYASNEEVKIQVMNYLPLLRRKFDSLGIEVTKTHCQLGKIPDSLRQRPYHMFQAKA